MSKLSSIGNQRGFTVIELMISTTAFSFILTGLTVGIIQVSKMFYKGVIVSQTQGVARTVIDEVSRPVQFSVQTPQYTGGPTGGVLCIGDIRYTYRLNVQVNDAGLTTNHRGLHALWRDKRTGVGCLPSPMNTVDGREMLAQHMRLTAFSVTPVTGTTSLYNVNVGIVYGDDETLTDPNNVATMLCRNSTIGSQWCATASLATQIKQRLR